MSALILYVLAVLLAGGLAALGGLNARGAWRWVAPGLLVPLIALAFIAPATLLSKPKPIDWDWFSSASEVAVLGSRIDEGEAIYLWLQIPDAEEPRAYSLPFDRKTAEALQEAQREAERNGSGVMMRHPFERSLEQREPMFYALPQPALPPKEEPPPPERYLQSDT